MIELVVGDARVTVHPDAGGRVGQIEVGGRPFLKPYEDRDLAWGYWGSYPLIPWSNRIVGGRFTFRGRTYQLPVNFPDGSAIHGLTCTVPWTAAEANASSCTLTIVVDTPPWTALRAEQRFTLVPGALEQEITVRNDGDNDVPVGIGIHPWFRRGPLQVPADMIWPDVASIPSSPPRAITRQEDLRDPVTDLREMDVAYTGLTASSARIGDLTLEWSDAAKHVVVYTGEPDWVCVEPVTNANDGFNLFERGWPDTGVIVLGPGEATGITYTLRW